MIGALKPDFPTIVAKVGLGTTDSGGTVLRPTRTGCEWWTYAGLKANAALVHGFGLPATFDSDHPCAMLAYCRTESHAGRAAKRLW